MNTQLSRAFFDACHKSKRILKYLPPLPDWMTPRQIHVIDAIHELSTEKGSIRPSDIASCLEGTMPSITRILSDLEAHGVVIRIDDPRDRRSHTLQLTPYGEKLYERYVEWFHTHIAELFSDISEDDMRTTIAVIERAEELLKNDTIIKETTPYE